MDGIILNVKFERENEMGSLSNSVHVVPSDISWENFDLMVGPFAVYFLLRNQGEITHNLVQ